MHHTYIAVKEAEYVRVMRAIPEIDYELYLYIQLAKESVTVNWIGS